MHRLSDGSVIEDWRYIAPVLPVIVEDPPDPAVLLAERIVGAVEELKAAILSLHARNNSGTTGDNSWVEVPSPGVRTRYFETFIASGVGTAVRGPIAAAHTATAGGVGAANAARQTVAARTLTATGVGTAARTMNVGLNPITAVGVGTATGRADLGFGLIPDIGGIAVQPLIVVDDCPPLP